MKIFAQILKMKVNVVTMDTVLQQIALWVDFKKSKYICVSNVHMCMEVFDSDYYRGVVNRSDLTLPDGKPLVWCQNLLGYFHANQIRGYDLTLAVCCMAEKHNTSIGLFGSSEKTINKFRLKLHELFPNLNISYAFSPPFRDITSQENLQYISDINKANVDILLVGLGCPKQEIWMSEHSESVRSVMIGVGAVFDFVAGNKKHAPLWVQKIGLEWAFRFFSEPARLWKRYLKHNPRFVYYTFLQLLGRNYD